MIAESAIGAIIGATATVVDESELIRNVADFERMPGVAAETY